MKRIGLAVISVLYSILAYSAFAAETISITPSLEGKFSWHKQVNYLKNIEGTVPDIVKYILADVDVVNGNSVMYQVDGEKKITLRADPAQGLYLKDGSQCRTVTITTIVDNKVANSFGSEACAKLDLIVPPVRKIEK